MSTTPAFVMTWMIRLCMKPCSHVRPPGRYEVLAMRRWLRWPRAILSAALLLLLAAWGVPRISAARFEEPIRAALESALGRKIHMGQVRFELLPLPGFTIDHVYIGEDPTIGAEVTAYIDLLRARP